MRYIYSIMNLRKGNAMNIHSAFEIAQKLSNLASKAVDEKMSSYEIIDNLVRMANNYLDLAESMENEMLAQTQQNSVETN